MSSSLCCRACSRSPLTLGSLYAWFRASALPLAPPARSFAAPAKSKDAKKKGAPAPAAPAVDPTAPLDVSFMVVAKGAKPPAIKPDAEYPQWLFDRDIYAPPSLAELRVRVDSGEKLSPELQKRMTKLERKRAIKDGNDASRKA